MKKGIDVSENNGTVDWQAAVLSGIEFAIIRCSMGQFESDALFAQNVALAHAAGLQVGAYHYSYAMDKEQSAQEAQNCKRAINDAGVLLELPVFYDMEDADGWKAQHNFSFNKNKITNMCQVFINDIGLDSGIYSSHFWLCNYIDWQVLQCTVWNAEWGNTDSVRGYMWQYTDKFKIGTNVFDGDILY